MKRDKLETLRDDILVKIGEEFRRHHGGIGTFSSTAQLDRFQKQLGSI